MPKKTVNERFWAKVDKTGDCWIWTANKLKGYGKFSVEGRYCIAHRVSWTLHNGLIPSGLFVLHKCDNPSCVNPDHLFLGTHQDNMNDMAAKGRKAVRFGSSNSKYRITNDQVVEIRIAAKTKSQTELATIYKVSNATISYIVKGKRRFQDLT